MSAKKGMRVAIAGGGTGGHLYPGIAMYEALADRVDSLEVLFVGVRGAMDEKILATSGLPHVLLHGRGLRGASLMRKVTMPIRFFAGVVEAARTLSRFRPDVVVGTGGYASASVVAAAVLRRTPVVLQEQNSIPGLVNRRLARFANHVLLSYEASRKWIPAGTGTSVVGNPLRRMPSVSRGDAAEFFGLDPDLATVLMIGGSRGAHSLNVAGAEAARRLAADGVQSILLTGDNDHAATRDALADIEGSVRVLAYLDDVHNAYAVADVAVARAGASSVFELARWGIPSVFVPYPYAADDHQALNAEPLAARGAALVIRDADLEGAGLAETLRGLLDDGERRRGMSAAMQEWAGGDAAEAAADVIAGVVKKKSAIVSDRAVRVA